MITREIMAELVRTNHFKRCAEIGVWRGEGSWMMVKSGANEVIMVDPMDRKLNASFNCRMGEPEKTQEELDKICLDLERIPCTKFYRMVSIEASKLFPNKSFDFVYIDGLHTYEALKADIAVWTPKVRIGGMIAGDDFGLHTELGKAVLEHFPDVKSIETLWYQKL